MCVSLCLSFCVYAFAETENCSLSHDFKEVYKGMKALQNSQKVAIDIDVQHPSLKPKLRPYQQDAVRWMLNQEHFGKEDISGSTGALKLKVKMFS